MIDEADRAAIVILVHAAEEMAARNGADGFEGFAAMKTLYHAVRHLAYPDRDIYPKVRGSRKSDPVKSLRQPWKTKWTGIR